MPTLLGLMGCTIPDTVQGLDLSESVLNDREDTVESVPLFYFRSCWRGVYTHDYTYTLSEDRNLKSNISVLYDRKRDPHQRINQITTRDYKSVREKLQEQTQEWQDVFEDPWVDFMTLWNGCGIPQKTGRTGQTGLLSCRPIEIGRR
jgi:hypothetical protein